MLKQKRSIARRPPPIDRDLQRDRIGHNDTSAGRSRPSRITYLAHAKGYVMARHPGCSPFAISEALWSSFPYWTASPAPTATEVLIGEEPNPLLGLPAACGGHLTTPVDADELRNAYAAIVNNARTKTHTSAPVHPRQGKPAGYPDADGGDIPGVNPSDLNSC